MSYRYVEHKYPNSDPNIDLNFNNDILYSNLTSDKYVDYIRENRNNDVKPSPSSKKKPIVKKQSSYMTYAIFFIIIIGLLVLWYYNKQSTQTKTSAIDTYPDTAKLTLLSPDIGTRAFYR